MSGKPVNLRAQLVEVKASKAVAHHGIHLADLRPRCRQFALVSSSSESMPLASATAVVGDLAGVVVPDVRRPPVDDLGLCGLKMISRWPRAKA
jgi:hypothetical protein